MKILLQLFLLVHSALTYPQGKMVEARGIPGLVELGMTKSKVRRNLGPSEKCILVNKEVYRTWSEGVVDLKIDTTIAKHRNIYCYPVTGLRVIFRSGRVYRIEVSSTSYRTPTGIGLGSSREEVQRIHNITSDAPRLWFHRLGIAYHFNGEGIVRMIEVLTPQE